VTKEPKYSIDHHSSPDWEPDHSIERWSAQLSCDETNCGEIVNLIGDSELVEIEYDEPGGYQGWAYESMLFIRAMFPAPPLFAHSPQVPYKVRDQLDLASQMYWTDTSACVSRLRTAVEAILDQQKVPKERHDKKGKQYRMNLEQRIHAFASNTPNSDFLNGLRNIGNLGTHGANDVTDDDLFDAIDVLEHVIGQIYLAPEITTKAKKLASRKSNK
jgi:hypothetical protein